MDNAPIDIHHTAKLVYPKTTALICREALNIASHSTLHHAEGLDMGIGIEDAYIGIVHTILGVAGHKACVVEVEVIDLHVVDI